MLRYQDRVAEADALDARADAILGGVRFLAKYVRPAYADYEDIAVLNALHLALRRGVPKEALEVATVAPSGLGGHDGGGVARLPHGMPNYYEVWLRVAGCDSLIYMKASFTGRLFSVRDKGGCLKPGAASKSEVQ